MLSKQQTKGLARWKPLLVLPLAVALVLVFAESRTVVKDSPAAIAAPAPGVAFPPAQEVSEEQKMEQALKEKALQLEDLKKKNTETKTDLKHALQVLHAETDELMKKVEAVRSATVAPEKLKQPAEKRVEKK